MKHGSDTQTPEQTDAQKFDDAMRSILAAPKKEVMAQLAKEKEERKKQRAVKKQ